MIDTNLARTGQDDKKSVPMQSDGSNVCAWCCCWCLEGGKMREGRRASGLVVCDVVEVDLLHPPEKKYITMKEHALYCTFTA